MKKVRYGDMPIPMPAIPENLTGLRGFAAQVVNSLKALRDRPVLLQGSTASVSPPHPFKASANGDDTIKIAPGKVLYWTGTTTGSAPNDPFTMTHQPVTETDVTVTGNGTIYLVIQTESTSPLEVSDNGAFKTYVYTPNSPVSSAITVEYQPTPAVLDLLIPICSVTLSDGTASVTNQILQENYKMELTFAV